MRASWAIYTTLRRDGLRRAGNPLGWFADKSKSGGGPLIDLGVHIIDMSRYLMGKPKPVSVSCMTYGGIGSRTNIKGMDRYTAADPSPNCDVEDMAVAMIRFGKRRCRARGNEL